MSFLYDLFGPPGVEKLKAKGNVRTLIRVLHYKKDVNVLGENTQSARG